MGLGVLVGSCHFIKNWVPLGYGSQGCSRVFYRTEVEGKWVIPPVDLKGSMRVGAERGL